MRIERLGLFFSWNHINRGRSNIGDHHQGGALIVFLKKKFKSRSVGEDLPLDLVRHKELTEYSRQEFAKSLVKQVKVVCKRQVLGKSNETCTIYYIGHMYSIFTIVNPLGTEWVPTAV